MEMVVLVFLCFYGWRRGWGLADGTLISPQNLFSFVYSSCLDPRKEYEKEYLSESRYLPYVLDHPDFDKLTPQGNK